jgi:hypothetical protein
MQPLDAVTQASGEDVSGFGTESQPLYTDSSCTLWALGRFCSGICPAWGVDLTALPSALAPFQEALRWYWEGGTGFYSNNNGVKQYQEFLACM